MADNAKIFKTFLIHCVKNDKRELVAAYGKAFTSEKAFTNQMAILNKIVPTGVTEDRQGRFEVEAIDTQAFDISAIHQVLGLRSYVFYKEQGYLIVVDKNVYVDPENNYLTKVVEINGKTTDAFKLISGFIKKNVHQNAKIELKYSFKALSDEDLQRQLNRPEQCLVENAVAIEIAPGIIAYAPDQWTTNRPKVTTKPNGERLGDLLTKEA